MSRLTKALLLACSLAQSAHADALAKLNPKSLEAVHRAVAELQSKRRQLVQAGPYREYRANLHVHSALSHDSRGTLDEIVAAARAVGTHVLLFSEHPAEHYDYMRDGHRGLKNGVLLIPGAETSGFLAYPTRSLHGVPAGSPQEFADLVRNRGGLIFLSHLEERMDWQIHGLTGTEIYNTHADLKDEKNLLDAVKNPFWIMTTAELFRKYPQEAFSALQDYPTDYLKRWDELCHKTPHTGIGANDSHQNIGVIAKLMADNKVRVEDALGKKLIELDATALATAGLEIKNKKVGDSVYRLHLDRYENSLRHVGTHLLLGELTEAAVWDALQSGRAFVAFDWLVDATGFDFAVYVDKHRFEMGSRVTLAKDLRLRGRAPLPGHWKLIRDGKFVTEHMGEDFDIPIREPGIYRTEVWLQVAGQSTIWILSNPIYVRQLK